MSTETHTELSMTEEQIKHMAQTHGDEDIAYELGKRDGYESAIQDIDLATGGDGEFVGSTFPGRTVDVPVMKARIVDRFRVSTEPAANSHDALVAALREISQLQDAKIDNADPEQRAAADATDEIERLRNQLAALPDDKRASTADYVAIPVEALRNCGCPSDTRMRVGECTDAGTCGCSIMLRERGIPETYQETVRKVAAIREKRLAESVEENKRLAALVEAFAPASSEEE